MLTTTTTTVVAAAVAMAVMVVLALDCIGAIGFMPARGTVPGVAVVVRVVAVVVVVVPHMVVPPVVVPMVRCPRCRWLVLATHALPTTRRNHRIPALAQHLCQRIQRVHRHLDDGHTVKRRRRFRGHGTGVGTGAEGLVLLGSRRWLWWRRMRPSLAAATTQSARVEQARARLRAQRRHAGCATAANPVATVTTVAGVPRRHG